MVDLPNFERFVAVDWSGAESPAKSGAIAMAECRAGSSRVNIINEVKSRRDVAEMVAHYLKQESRTLIGIDCNFGYARAIGEKQFGKGYTFRDLWLAVEESSHNLPDFYAKGFWTHYVYAPYFWTGGKQDGFKLHRRQTENRCGALGYGFPESPFKMIGPKQVGKGGLAGMRFAHYIKEKYGESVAFWPFERALAGHARIVISEIYPRIFLRLAGHGPKKVTQAAELKKVLDIYGCYMPDLAKFSDHQSDAIVAAAGLKNLCGDRPDVPGEIAKPEGLAARVAETEGWIFGVK